MTTMDILKNYFKNEFANRRAELGLSQEEMAENLNISLRSYSDLEHGKYCCSLSSFINYVNNCGADKDRLFSDFAEIFGNSEN